MTESVLITDYFILVVHDTNRHDWIRRDRKYGYDDLSVYVTSDKFLPLTDFNSYVNGGHTAKENSRK